MTSAKVGRMARMWSVEPLILNFVEWRTRAGAKCLVGEFVERVLVRIRLEY